MIASKSFGGGPLLGENAVRFVHLDESGISDHEPFAVVAGVMCNADRDWKRIGGLLHALADKLAPPGQRDGFVFHAKELYSGGKNFPRDQYSREDRWQRLDRILAIPGENELPVFFGWVDKANFRKLNPNASPEHISVVTHAVAFAECIFQVERVMREAYPDEVATLVVEDRPEARETIRNLDRYLKDPRQLDWLTDEDRKYLPLTRIAESPLFAEKTDSSHLQLADTCAFTLNKFIKAKHALGPFDIDRFYEPIKPWMVVHPKESPSWHAA